MSSTSRKSPTTPTSSIHRKCSSASPSVEPVPSADTVTHAVAMASAIIKNDHGGLKSKERQFVRQDQGSSKNEECSTSTIIMASTQEEIEEEGEVLKLRQLVKASTQEKIEEEEVLKLRRLVKIIQREKEHLQGQCSTFERAGMQITARNMDLQKTIKGLQVAMQSLHNENQSLIEKLMEVTSHMNQVVMPNYHWYYHRAHSLEFNHRMLLNNHQQLRRFCDSLLLERNEFAKQEECNNNITRGEHGAGPKIEAAAQSQETSQKVSRKEQEKSRPVSNVEVKRMHHPFLQPRRERSQFIENDKEGKPQNRKHDMPITANSKSTVTAPRRCRPSLQIPSASHASSSSAVDDTPITETPKTAGPAASTETPKVFCTENGFNTTAAIATAPPGPHQVDRHVTPSPRISYRMTPSNGSQQQQQLVPHPYFASIPNHNMTEHERVAVPKVPSFPPPPTGFCGAVPQMSTDQNDNNHVVGQKRRILTSGRGGSRCVTGSKKRKPSVTL